MPTVREAHFSPADVKHIRGRTYKVTVDPKHRPFQVPRGSAAVVYAGEVTSDIAAYYDVMFIDWQLRDRLEHLAARGHKDGSGCTFNELLRRVVPYLEQTAALGPDPEPSSWMPDQLG